MEDWAIRIHGRMLEQGKIPADLARACKIKPGSVSGWFGQGKPTKMISGDNLVAVAAYLQTTAEYIMTGRSGMKFTESQAERLDEANISQGIELLYLLADTRPDDPRFERPTWPLIKVAAKAISRAEGSHREAVAEILAELAKEI